MAKTIVRNPARKPAAKPDVKEVDQRCEMLKKYLNDKSTPNTMERVRQIIKGGGKKDE